MNKLWLYWGQEHLSFLRYLTLFSACQIHDNVALILRKKPVRPRVDWKERQDFQQLESGDNWMDSVDELPLERIFLEDFAPEIAELKAPDIHMADLLRWWILARFGGTVADMDIVFLGSVPEIENEIQVVVFSGTPKPGYIPVSFIQGKPCAFWLGCDAVAKKLLDPNDYESCGTPVLSAVSKLMDPPIELTSGVDEHVVFPWAGRYPWSQWHRWLFDSEDWPTIPPQCCGIHWYAGHNQAWNQKIKSEKDLGRGAVSWAVRKVLNDQRNGRRRNE